MNLICANCGYTNPAGMRFCGQCGKRLPDALPSEPHIVPRAVSPADLGIMMGANLLERFRRAGLDAAGQRRVVTVLFADLAGYTELSERLDPEDLYGLIQRMIAVLAADVYKYDGAVDKFTGDGLMALFGAPIANENSAESAVRAAADMQADLARFSESVRGELGQEVRLHVGLHSGSVVVGSIGSDMLMNYTAIGDTVNLARRLEEASQPGAIVVSESVYQQTQALFAYEAVPPLTLKGIGHPVPAYRWLRLRDLPGSVRGLAGLHAPMIGRERELHTVLSAAGELAEGRPGQVILITGEAGLGKSRLVMEVQAQLAGGPVRVFEGHSLTYRRSAAYWVFIDLLHNYLRVSQATPPDEVRARLRECASEALGPRADDALPFLETLLALTPSAGPAAARLRSLDGSRLRQQIFLAVRDLFMAEARRQPVLLILEDLHWADDASLELLLALASAVQQAPLLILAATRPLLEASLAGAAARLAELLGPAFVRVELQFLSPSESERLLFELTSVPDFPAPVRSQILQRAAGIPFYLEEILRMLIDSEVMRLEAGHWRVLPGADVTALQVPDTLQSLILARFDRLSELQRRLLQIAAVIGRQFSRAMLVEVLRGQAEPAGGAPHEQASDADLALLASREFIVRLPRPAETEFEFKHALVSDAIYRALLRRDRSELHGQVARALERLYAGHLDEHVDALARHFAWSPHLDRALHYLTLAGEKAARGYGVEQARRHYEQALGLLPEVAHTLPQALAVHSGLGEVLFSAGEYERAREQYQVAVRLMATEASLGRERSALERKLSRTYERQGLYDEALSHLALGQRALDEAGIDSPVDQASIQQDVGWIHFRRGEFAPAQQLLLGALQLVEGTEALDVVASIYNRLGGLAYNQGDWSQCASYVRKSIAIREALGDVVTLADSFNNLGVLEIELGQYDSALENLTRSQELKRRQNQADGIAIALNNLGLLHVRRGDLPAARAALVEALEMARQTGYTSLLGSVLMHFGELHLAADECAEAAAALEQSAKLFQDLGVPDQLLEIYRLLGEASLQLNDLAEAVKWSEQADTLSARLGANVNRLSVIQRGEHLRFRGQLAIYQKDWSGAQHYLRESETIFTSLGNRLYEGRIAFEYGRLARQQGERQQAQLHFREASLLFRSVGARLEVKRAEEALAQPGAA